MEYYIIAFIFALAVFVLIYTILRPSKIRDNDELWNMYKNEPDKKNRRRLEKDIIRTEKKEKKKKGLGARLFYSGLSRRYSFLNTGWYLFITFVIAIIGLIIAFVVTDGNTLISFISAVMSALVSISYVSIKSDVNYKRVDNQLIKFTNLIENFSKSSSGDLLSLLKDVSIYLDEPLYSAVTECVNEAMITGNDDEAFNHLKMKIESSLFKDIISNLQIASRHESNYSEVIVAYRRILRDHSRTVQNTKNLINIARADILIMIIMSVIILRMVQSMMSGSIIHVMTSNAVGVICIGFLAIVFAVIVGIFLNIGRRETY